MSNAAQPTAFIAPRSAAWICATLLAGLGVMVAFSLAEHPKAATLETFSQTTAAGDTVYYTPPTPALAVPEPVFSWQGHAWAPASYDKTKIDDPDMKRVGKDETTGLTIYEARAKTPAGYFIKIAIGEYLRIEQR